MLSMGAGAVGNRCDHPWRWVHRDFRTAEIVLDAIYTLEGGEGGLSGSPLDTAYADVVYGFLMFGKAYRQVSLEAGK